ncbi:hypothetical protein ACQ902_003695, partial [Vibrio mimicus]
LGFLFLGRKNTITTDTRAPRRAFPSAFSDFLLSLSILYSSIPVSTLLHFISFPSLITFK